jgi:anti-sigma-K factor RskA
MEAYALHALEPAERAAVEQHIAVCPSCRKLAQASEEAAHMLALCAGPQSPPLRCKRTVLGRIEREEFLRKPAPRRAQQGMPLSTWGTMAAVLLWAVTGGWGMTLQGKLQQANTEMANMRTAVALQATQTAQMQQSMAQLLSMDNVLADGSEICTLKDQRAQMAAKCYARPGENDAVIVAKGLPPLEPGKVYQLWLAHDNVQEPLTPFTPHDGVARVKFAPREPLNRYTTIMITVENAGGSTKPSEETVLVGDF